MASRLNPYISFKDNAREAMTFYQNVFGGDLDVNTFGDYGAPDADDDGIMHAQLEAPNGFTLMASDPPPGDSETTPNGHISLSGDSDDGDLLRGYFDRLAEGGHIDVPLEKAPWGDEFGQVKDKFGVNWLVNIAGSPG